MLLTLLAVAPAVLRPAPSSLSAPSAAVRATSVRMMEPVLPPPPPPPQRARLATPTQPSFERRYGTGLRELAVDTLDELREPTTAALIRERKALLAKRERGLLYASAAALLVLTTRRVSLRAAVAIFLVARCGTAALARRPDPRVLVTLREMAVATRQAVGLAAEAVQLAALTVAFSGCALSASLELVGRMAIVKTTLALEASAAANDAAEVSGVNQSPPHPSNHDPITQLPPKLL